MLVLSRFNFLLNFYPAKKNVKTDALSRSFDPTDLASEPELMIDPDCFISAAPLYLHEIPLIFVPWICRKRNTFLGPLFQISRSLWILQISGINFLLLLVAFSFS